MSVLQTIQTDPTDFKSVLAEIETDPTAFFEEPSPSRPGPDRVTRSVLLVRREIMQIAGVHTIPVSPLTQTLWEKSQDLEVAKTINSILFCAISILRHLTPIPSHSYPITSLTTFSTCSPSSICRHTSPCKPLERSRYCPSTSNNTIGAGSRCCNLLLQLPLFPHTMPVPGFLAFRRRPPQSVFWIKGKDNVTKEVSILWKDCNTFGMDCETLSIVSALQRKKWYVISKNITKRCSVMSCNATNASFSHLKSPLKDTGTPA